MLELGVERLRKYIKKTAALLGKIFAIKDGTTPILMYHSIHPEHPLAIKPGAFREQVEFLVDNFQVLSLSQYITAKKEKRLQPGMAVITFDDGYEDNYTYAYPILQEYACPATIFIATGFIEAKDYKTFGRQVGLYKDLPPLTWQEAERMLDLVEFGAHTHSHVQVSALDPHVLEREINTNIELLTQRIGIKPSTFAYPWGQPVDFKQECLQLIQEKFSGAVTTVYSADNRQEKISPYYLRRIGISPADDREFFTAKITGALELLRPAKVLQAYLGEKDKRNNDNHI
ncbi:MAG: polysaccharide deacetylase family protein [bacterium]